MADKWTSKWDDRYRDQEFAYGEKPNDYLKAQLERLSPGTILFPAEGEGRNAVFAAQLGWSVAAYDISSEGQKKALQHAQKNNVSIDYQIGDVETINYQDAQFDAIALIYAHFPPGTKSATHKALDKYLRRGGTIIFEAFSKNHIDYIAKNEKVGGPKDIESLFSVEEIKTDFINYNIIELIETEINLDEGIFHKGQASVIRFLGRKK